MSIVVDSMLTIIHISQNNLQKNGFLYKICACGANVGCVLLKQAQERGQL